MAFAVFCAILFFTILVLIPLSSSAQRSSNVTLGASLVADSTNSSWLSPSGDFAFGFQRIAPDGVYLLAIWFDKIPEKTIVWSANRGSPAEERSKVQLLADGSLELSGPRGDWIWNVARSSGLPTAPCLTVTLEQGLRLISDYSDTNYSMGRFVCRVQDGKLVFQSRNFPMDDAAFTYTYCSTQNVPPAYQLIFNESGYIFLATNNGTVLEFLSRSGPSTSMFYQRAILEYDGVLRHYVYPKFANSTDGRVMEWSLSQSSPLNICFLFLGVTGSGACGFNSVCSVGTDTKTNCSCPDGYSPVDSNIRISGCKPNFAQPDCDQQSQEADLFRFTDLPNTDFVWSVYTAFGSMTEDQCRQACLEDCFCPAVVYNNGNCWKKRFPLSNGRFDTNFTGKTMIKIRKNNETVHTPTSNSKTNGSNRSTLIITLSVLLGCSMFLLALTSNFLFLFHLNEKKSSTHPEVNLRSFGFNELQEATNGFTEELGRGASSIVYKGTLRNENDRRVAVKKLDKIPKEAEQEFKAEVRSISKTNHKNLVMLLGYCDEGQNRLLVYEFMSNGSLASFLFQKSRPSWYRRVQIALATARGLCYLHEECNTQIIHCDIKPNNVLLDDCVTAKIADFGLAKLLKPDQTKTTTVLRGTRGYVAPEWFRNMPISSKVDVYSFGILLLELVCCRRKVERHAEDETEVILCDWAYDCYETGTLKLLVENDEEALEDIKRFKKFVMVGIWCIQEDPSLRPNMKRVVHMLEGAIDVPNPPHPESFIT